MSMARSGSMPGRDPLSSSAAAELILTRPSPKVRPPIGIVHSPGKRGPLVVLHEKTDADSPLPIYYGFAVAFPGCIQAPQLERSFW
jgi:hypothetical protein